MAGKCKILIWDQNCHVKGMIAVSDGGAVKILAAAEGAPGRTFSSQLHEVNVALKKHHADAVLIGGFISEYICFEIPSPNVDRKTLKNMLRFELPGHIPVALDGMSIFFRQIRRSDGKCKTRIFAVRSRVWRELLDQVRESGIKFDAYCHPFMATDLIDGQTSAAFPAVAPGLELAIGENGLAALRNTAPSAQPDTSAEVMASYALGRGFHKDKPFLSSLSEEFKLHRFKNSRRIAVFLALLIVFSGGVLLWRYWSDRDRQVALYQRAISQIEEQLLARNSKIENERVLSTFAGKMLEAVDEEPLLPVLEILSSKLPGNTWVTSFRGGNNRIALTLSVTGESSALNEVLGELGNWQLENQRQQDGPDGTRTLYVTLLRK